MLAILLIPLDCAAGADFRGLAFGEQCTDLAERERVLGSTVTFRESDGTKHLDIRAIHLGHEALVDYDCDYENLLRSGVYVYYFGTYEEAAGFFVETRPLLLGELGEPYIDSASAEYLAVMRAAQYPIDDENRYDILWAFDSHTVGMSVHRLPNDSTATAMVMIRYRSKSH